MSQITTGNQSYKRSDQNASAEGARSRSTENRALRVVNYHQSSDIGQCCHLERDLEELSNVRMCSVLIHMCTFLERGVDG